jgi:hypothetical protein
VLHIQNSPNINLRTLNPPPNYCNNSPIPHPIIHTWNTMAVIDHHFRAIYFQYTVNLTSPCTRLDVHNFSRIYLTSFASRRICYLFHQSTKHPYIRLSNHGSGVFGRSLSFSEQRPPVTSSKRSALSRGNRGFFTSYCPSLTVRFIVKFISGIWFQFRFRFFSNLTIVDSDRLTRTTLG